MHILEQNTYYNSIKCIFKQQCNRITGVLSHKIWKAVLNKSIVNTLYTI